MGNCFLQVNFLKPYYSSEVKVRQDVEYAQNLKKEVMRKYASEEKKVQCNTPMVSDFLISKFKQV